MVNPGWRTEGAASASIYQSGRSVEAAALQTFSAAHVMALVGIYGRTGEQFTDYITLGVTVAH